MNSASIPGTIAVRLPLLLWLVFLGGCSTVSDTPVDSRPVSAGQMMDTKAVLYAQHAEWGGTPYRLGGISKRGIDCSGFVQTTFLNRFDIWLPRTAEEQAAVGRPVSRHEVLPGDLVFFRTGRGKYHVGIYVENGRFMHASTSEGVTLSSLNDPYWSARYWKSKRLAGTVALR